MTIQMSESMAIAAVKKWAASVIRFAEISHGGPFQHPLPDGATAFGPEHVNVCFMVGGNFGFSDLMFEAVRVLGGHKQPAPESVNGALTPDQKDAERRAFEQWYVCNAFDYVRDPLGSKLCADQWAAWKYRAANGVMEGNA